MPKPVTVFEEIERKIKPFQGYKPALVSLECLPPGYSLCFAFHYVDADLSNGGNSQLYSNSTWCLILTAQRAAEVAAANELSSVIKEIVYYYHRKGRSKLKRSIPDGYFNDMPKNWDKSLSDLENDYFALDSQREQIIETLCRTRADLFNVQKT